MFKFEKSCELRAGLHCPPFVLSKAFQKSLKRIRVDVPALPAGNERGEYEIGTVCHCDEGAGSSGSGSTKKGLDRRMRFAFSRCNREWACWKEVNGVGGWAPRAAW